MNRGTCAPLAACRRSRAHNAHARTMRVRLPQKPLPSSPSQQALLTLQQDLNAPPAAWREKADRVVVDGERHTGCRRFLPIAAVILGRNQRHPISGPRSSLSSLITIMNTPSPTLPQCRRREAAPGSNGAGEGFLLKPATAEPIARWQECGRGCWVKRARRNILSRSR